MADFSTDIDQFQKNGTYTYEFDDAGNLYFNSASTDFSHLSYVGVENGSCWCQRFRPTIS